MKRQEPTKEEKAYKKFKNILDEYQVVLLNKNSSLSDVGRARKNLLEVFWRDTLNLQKEPFKHE